MFGLEKWREGKLINLDGSAWIFMDSPSLGPHFAIHPAWEGWRRKNEATKHIEGLIILL